MQTLWAEKADSHPTVFPLSSPSRFPVAGAMAGPEVREEEEEEVCSWWNKEAGLIHLKFDPMCVLKVCVHSASLSSAKVRLVPGTQVTAGRILLLVGTDT